MSRHLDNLQRLLRKLQTCCGDDHTFTVQVKQEVASLEAIEFKESGWFTTYRDRPANGSAWRRSDVVSDDPT